VHEVVQHEVRHAEAVLDRLHTEGYGQMRLADAGRPQEEHVLPGAHEGAGAQYLELAPVRSRLKGPVEALERLAGRQPGELEGRGDASLRLSFDLTFQHAVEEAEWREVLPARLLHQFRKALSRVSESQGRAALRGGVQVHRHTSRAHASASTSCAYAPIGRLMSGAPGSCSTVLREGRESAASWRRARRPSGVGASTRSVDSPS
jgi:hypothetical protein